MGGLIDALTNGYGLLKNVGADYWANKINRVLLSSSGSEEKVDVEEILSWFGGMGALNDLIISKFNEHCIKDKDEDDINDKLREVTSQLYELAIVAKKCRYQKS